MFCLFVFFFFFFFFEKPVCFVLIWVRLCRLLVLYCMAWCGIGIKDSRVVNTIGYKLCVSAQLFVFMRREREELSSRVSFAI